PRMDFGCVRFLSRGRHPDRNRERISSHRQRDRALDCAYARLSTRRSVHFRFAGRPLWPAFAVDDRSGFLFGGRSSLGVSAKLRDIHGFAGTVWHWYGWRMGRWCFAGYGESASQVARRAFRTVAGGLRLRLSARGHLLLFCLSALGVEAIVFHRRLAGYAGPLCQIQSEGIRGLEENQTRELGPAGSQHHFALETLHLSDNFADGDELRLARYAGHVSDFPGTSLGFQPPRPNTYNGAVDGWRNHWWRDLWIHF